MTALSLTLFKGSSGLYDLVMVKQLAVLGCINKTNRKQKEHRATWRE